MPPEPPSSPSLRTLAKLGGVSAMTVSMALRNDPRVAAGTRARLQQLARAEGYRPDPAVNKLMLHLRLRRTARTLRGSICALVGEDVGKLPAYHRSILDGARCQATAAGFGFEVLPFDAMLVGRGRLRRVLVNRGIEGVLLLPMPTVRGLPADIGWDAFSVMAATYSIVAPNFHRVVPHHFNNCLRICRELGAQGFRRIGLAVHEKYDLRTHHHFSAVIAWHNLNEGGGLVRPLLFDGPEFIQPAAVTDEHRAQLRAWFAQEKPDAIVTGFDDLAFAIADALRLPVPGPVPIWCTSLFGDPRLSGIDERPAVVAEKAIDLLTGMILRGEKGIPATPIVTMVDGQLCLPPPRRAKTKRQRRA